MAEPRGVNTALRHLEYIQRVSPNRVPQASKTTLRGHTEAIAEIVGASKRDRAAPLRLPAMPYKAAGRSR